MYNCFSGFFWRHFCFSVSGPWSRTVQFQYQFVNRFFSILIGWEFNGGAKESANQSTGPENRKRFSIAKQSSILLCLISGRSINGFLFASIAFFLPSPKSVTRNWAAEQSGQEKVLVRKREILERNRKDFARKWQKYRVSGRLFNWVRKWVEWCG